MKEQTKEGNRLIAEFMGIKTNAVIARGANRGKLVLNPIHYHERWEMLMPVVEKIHSHNLLPNLTKIFLEKKQHGKQRDQVIEYYGHLKDTLFYANIKGAWLCVLKLIELIEWYENNISVRIFEPTEDNPHD